MKTNILVGIIAACVLGVVAESHASPILNVHGKISAVHKKDSTTQTYNLDIDVMNFGDQDQTYTVAWYFIQRTYGSEGKRLPEIYKAGEKKCAIAAKKELKLKVSSYPLTTNKTKDGYSGSVFDDYLVVVWQDKKALKATSVNRDYQSDEWLLRARFAKSKEDSE